MVTFSLRDPKSAGFHFCPAQDLPAAAMWLSQWQTAPRPPEGLGQYSWRQENFYMTVSSLKYLLRRSKVKPTCSMQRFKTAFSGTQAVQSKRSCLSLLSHLFEGLPLFLEGNTNLQGQEGTKPEGKLLWSSGNRALLGGREFVFFGG